MPHRVFFVGDAAFGVPLRIVATVNDKGRLTGERIIYNRCSVHVHRHQNRDDVGIVPYEKMDTLAFQRTLSAPMSAADLQRQAILNITAHPVGVDAHIDPPHGGYALPKRHQPSQKESPCGLSYCVLHWLH